ncbi:fibronectin type III domain-containing protein 4-like [Microtus oregoni]|uniref:fibronectin type III domain-containing protein 4-like n=1 Tax=Microtus oregoni TaxID=111838 RepID=UPI001BB26FC6|nr:fibronectin type III domain-containing protein 4-like [Microtus oregoni]
MRGPRESWGPRRLAARGHSASALSARSSAGAARLGGPASGWDLLTCQHPGTPRPTSLSCECDGHSSQSQLGHCVLGRPRRQHRHWLLHFPATTERPFGQRVIREVNFTTRACALWGLAEDSDYTVQVRSIGLRGESPPGPRVHVRTLKGSDRLPCNSSSPGDITVEGLDGERPLQTGEVVIIVMVLLMWAAVIGLFCRQYDIIKDNDSNNNPKEKGKGPEQTSQGRPLGTRQVTWGPVSVRRMIWVPRSIQ